MEEIRPTNGPAQINELLSEDRGVPPERIVYTIPEIAALLGVDRATVYRWIHKGDIPVVRMGGSRMFVPKRLFLERFGIAEDVAVSS